MAEPMANDPDPPPAAPKPAAPFAILDTSSLQPNTVVPVQPPSLGARAARAAGTLGDFFIRYLRARTSPARLLYGGLIGLFAVFSAALLGVEAVASGTGASWAAQLKMTGLDTGQMAIMGITTLGLGGLAVHAYRSTAQEKKADKAWLMQVSQDPSLPGDLRARAAEAVLAEIAASAGGGDAQRQWKGYIGVS